MALVPPTPLMPSRFNIGWNLEDESLLMDQQPIFGDESMLDMTFEMGTEDGNDGDVSSRTIVAADLDNNQFNEEENSENDEDGECEVARDAQANLGHMDLPTFHNESQDNINLLQDLDPFDYPPSPFLSHFTYYANQPNVDVGTPIPVRPEEDIQEETTFTSQMNTVNPAQIEAVPTHPSLSMQSEPLELMLEETTFSARGEKSTWAEEERDSSLGPGGSLSRSVASGSGKRPASSPRRAAVAKKSKPRPQPPRSPSQDDLFSRLLSRSTSSISVHHDSEDGPSKDAVRGPSFGRNTHAGPSRPSPSVDVRIARKASPAIRSSSMEMSHQAQENVPPTPLPPPTLLSRLIAKSTVLHPRSSASDARPTQSPNRQSFADRSAPLENVIPLRTLSPGFGELPTLEYTRTTVITDPGSSLTNRESPLKTHPDDDIECPRQALTPDLDEPSWVNDPARDRLEISQPSFQDTSFAQRSEEHPTPIRDSSIISTTTGWLRRSMSRQEAIVEYKGISSIDSPRPPTSLSSSTSSDTVESSLRRSTSQRVIGFFSSILRSSTSSKSISDLGKSTSFKPDSVGGEDISLRLKEVQEQSGMDDLRSEYQQQQQQSEDQTGGEPIEEIRDISQSSYRSQSSSGSYAPTAHYSNPIPGIPPLPRYIPLTRPTKAFVSHTASRIDNPIRQPKPKAATSTFASTALARLPPPGKGSSASGQKVVVKPVERASNLQARRALFEKSTNRPVRPLPLGAKKAIPVKESILGHTTYIRTESRSKSDQEINGRWEEKRRLREMEEKRKREKEERELRERRKETVVRARPVPEMYRRKA